jgi:hypothetical protein
MPFVMFNAHAEGTVELFCSYSHGDRLLQQRFTRIRRTSGGENRCRFGPIGGSRPAAIVSQMGADEVKQQMERRRILQATQRKILEITADVQAAQTTTSQEMFEKWDEYLRA